VHFCGFGTKKSKSPLEFVECSRNELIRRTLAGCLETWTCVAMMVICDDVRDAEEIAATMTSLGL
jgi:hypothetical protein